MFKLLVFGVVCKFARGVLFAASKQLGYCCKQLAPRCKMEASVWA
jgi:hypothetical protein